MINRYSLIPLAIIPLLLLSACTADNKADSKAGQETINFDSQQLKVAPQWELDKLVPGSWGEGNAPSQTVPTDIPESKKNKEDIPANPDYIADGENNEIITEPYKAIAPDDVFLYNYVSFYDSSTKCRITGQLSYLEAFKENRGDEFNSKDYLYSLVPSSEDSVSNEKVEVIGNVEYVVGDYTQPKEWSENSFHRTAVRAFSNPITIKDASGFAESEVGNYNSDLTKGLSVAVIDYSCSEASSLTDEQWKDGVKHYSMLFDAKPPAALEGATEAPTGTTESSPVPTTK